jgi:glycosyltransferase involved in cell wall biosynthesis
MSPASGSSFRDKVTHPLAGLAVLQIVPDLRPGAAARSTIEIAAALSRVGATALVASRGGRMVSELQAKGGVFIPFPADAKNPFGMVLNIRRLARLIKAETVDIVHARSRASAWVAFGATRLTKTPFVTSFHGAYAGGNALDARYNSVMARGDAIIADSLFAAGLIAKLYPTAEGKIRVIPRGVDCRIFAPKAVQPARVQVVRRAWSVAPDESIVLLAASLAAGNGHKVLVEAARLLLARGLTGTRFILAGDEHSGRLGAEIDRAIAKAQLRDIVRRVGPCADMPAALLAAAVVVAPLTRPEACSGIVVEAQAMGTPVIVADQGASAEAVLAPPEIDATLRTGWRVAMGDAAALAEALTAALSLGATARDQLFLRARAHAERDFSLEQVGLETLDAYRAALGADEGPPDG